MRLDERYEWLVRFNKRNNNNSGPGSWPIITWLTSTSDSANGQSNCDFDINRLVLPWHKCFAIGISKNVTICEWIIDSWASVIIGHKGMFCRLKGSCDLEGTSLMYDKTRFYVTRMKIENHVHIRILACAVSTFSNIEPESRTPHYHSFYGQIRISCMSQSVRL